eukprot:m.106360 g.106360  ORF g.106360 m.106360 type:complete len:151 (-) comp16896_c0_seq2:262-714(-)
MSQIIRFCALLFVGVGRCVATQDGAAWTSVEGYGTKFHVDAEGTGDATVQPKSKVTVHATGTVKETLKKFWSTKDPGQRPFEYVAGVGNVITGWDQGVLGMKVGEIRTIEIPSDEGYGARGFPAWGIPANAGLVFQIRVLEIKTQQQREL